MKRTISLFFCAILVAITLMAATRSYGPVTLDYDTTTETNSAGVASVIVIWDKNQAKDINIVGSVTVGGETVPFCVSGSEGQKIIYFRGLNPDRRYSVKWEFIEPASFPR